MITDPSLIAGGDIRQARFIKLSGSADHTALEADANERIFGVSVDAAQDAPMPGASENAAEATDPFRYYGVGEECTVQVGSGGCTRGALGKSDADGKAVLAATTGTTLQWIACEFLESASEDELARIVIRQYPHYPALA